MGRAKEHWDGSLASYGPVFIDGRVVGFKVTIRAYDHTEHGRMIVVPFTAGQLRRIASAAEEAEDRNGEGQGTDHPEGSDRGDAA